MQHEEPWQVYSDNGLAIIGKSAGKNEFAEDQSLVMGASHVWIWRLLEGGIEVLLQKRATNKISWPGYWDISAAGHIDFDEDPVQAAVREVKEEIGVEIVTDELYYIFGSRAPFDKKELDTVFLWDATGRDLDFKFIDGEVEELKWITLEDFETMTITPDQHKLVPQGGAYFLLLLQNLRLHVE
jgi:isopentenyldiphosphate isomerase